MPVNFITPTKPNDGFPISHTNAAAAFTHVKDSPGLNNSYYITGILMTGGADGDGFSFIRRASVKFNGATDTLTITDSAALEPVAGDFSLVFGIKTADVSLSDIISKDDSSNNKYVVEVDSSGRLKCTIGDGTDTASITSYNPINDGEWHEVVISCDRDVVTGLNMYVDGVAAAAAVDPTDVDSITGGGIDLICTGSAGKTFYLSTLGLYKGGFLTAAQAKSRWGTDDGIGGGCGSKFKGDETNISFAMNLDEGVSTACNDLVAANDGSLSNTEWEDGTGLPIDGHTLKKSTKIACGVGAAFGPVALTFPHAIKIGRNNPLRIGETDGGFGVEFFGFIDAG
ncbi:hypothetical protein LCGC14_0476110 [marine sediment metagenome]|uniref:Laminin G domain-containing protein n=1 Tax=marine sediment metagenome TaxID=412755 RepID=A0A0F9SG38_9ZZZZ